MNPMTKAKTRMLLNHPFFAILLLKQKVIIDTDTETASVDGVYLRYNEIWFDSLGLAEQVFLLAHEVMHLALGHHLRRGKRDAKKWNAACDYAINLILVDAGLVMPKGGLLNTAYKGLSAEEIYDLLPQGQSQGQNVSDGQDGEPTDDQGQSLSGFGDVLDYPDPDTATQEALEQQSSLVEAAKAVEGRAYLPEALKRIVGELLNPTIPWYDTLERLRSEKAREDYSYSRPNRNYLARGLVIPSLANLNYANCVIAIDTSGSIRQDMLNKMLTEVSGVNDVLNNTLHVIYVDDMVREVDVFEAGDEIKPQNIKAVGGGGTDFVPPFEYVEENDLRPRMFLYFTDGLCRSFPSEPEYDVIWLCTNPNFNPPFGEVIYF